MSAGRTLLIDAFVSRLPGSLHKQAGEIGDLGARLEALVQDARAGQPDVAIDPLDFVGYLAARIPADKELGASLARVRGADLLLAYGCAQRDEAALAIFEKSYLGRLEEALSTFASEGGLVDDIRCQVRQEMLFGKDGGPGRIGEFAGRGDLWRWLRLGAVRRAIDHRRRSRKQVDLGEDRLLAVPAAERDPEMAFLRERYQREFAEVFQAALASLSRRQRNLLRHHHLDGLTIDEVAALYHVHRATAARQIAGARADLLAETRRTFLTRLRLGREEFESVMRMVQSQLQLSIERYLRHTQSSTTSDESDGGGKADAD